MNCKKQCFALTWSKLNNRRFHLVWCIIQRREMTNYNGGKAKSVADSKLKPIHLPFCKLKRLGKKLTATNEPVGISLFHRGQSSRTTRLSE